MVGEKLEEVGHLAPLHHLSVIVDRDKESIPLISNLFATLLLALLQSGGDGNATSAAISGRHNHRIDGGNSDKVVLALYCGVDSREELLEAVKVVLYEVEGGLQVGVHDFVIDSVPPGRVGEDS